MTSHNPENKGRLHIEPFLWLQYPERLKSQDCALLTPLPSPAFSQKLDHLDSSEFLEYAT